MQLPREHYRVESISPYQTPSLGVLASAQKEYKKKWKRKENKKIYHIFKRALN